MKIAAVTLGFLLVSPTATEGDGKNYEFDVSETSQQVSRGDEGTFQLRIQARPGFKVSQEAPLKITLRSDGLALKKKLLKAKDAKNKEWTSPEFAVGFSADESGDQNIDVDAVFFVCDARICERKKEKLSVAVSVLP